jgi:hypothetical protein
MYKITLDKDDYLRFQLYMASKSKKIKKGRMQVWILTTLTFLSISFIFIANGDRIFPYVFLLISAINVIFYPIWDRRRYKKQYERLVAENIKNKLALYCEISIDSEKLTLKDERGVGEISLSEIESIIEIKEDLFIKVKNGNMLIISKQITDYENFIQELKNASGNSDIPWIDELNWKW